MNEEIRNKDFLRKLKEVKKFPKHKHAEYAKLLEKNIVVKKYSKGDNVGKIHFDREVKFLKYLRKKNCPFATRILDWDRAEMKIWMTYCGEVPEDTPENRKTIKKLEKRLYEEFGLGRFDKTGKNLSKIEIPIHNTGILNGKINLFDFGGKKWRIINEKKTKNTK